MDGHLFRIFADNARGFINGAIIGKIREPIPGLLSLELYNHGQKKRLIFRSGKQTPCCFFTSQNLPAAAYPTAPVMRLRKYFGDRRVAAAVFEPWQRKLWLLASGNATEDGRNPWLCLDLAKGGSIHFLTARDAPCEVEAEWPTRNDMPVALENWRQWPMLTPPLRKTLKLLDAQERMALLNDLQAGGGDVFLYRDRGKIQAISAWPLADKGEYAEEICENPLQGMETAYSELVLEKLFIKAGRDLEERAARKARQLEKLLENLEKDEANLCKMAAQEETARKIQANLWNLPANERKKEISLPGGEKIELNGRLTIVENMERMFRQAARGKRGLGILAERKGSLQKELADFAPGGSQADGMQKGAGREQAQSPGISRVLPKNVMAFRSSDGFDILRGKDAKGNQAVRKLGRPYDIWCHVQKGAGAHVLIRKAWPGQEIPQKTLEEAGSLAAMKSWLAQAGEADVMYAEARHVKPMRKAGPGQVSIDRLACVRTVAILPELELKLATGAAKGGGNPEKGG